MLQVELLKFYLRMGFEDLDSKADDTAPISGVMDLPLPATLAVAAKGVCSAKEVEKCVHKGKALEAKQAGSPKGKMGKELYGSIMLYTGNAIYRDLNQVPSESGWGVRDTDVVVLVLPLGAMVWFGVHFHDLLGIFLHRHCVEETNITRTLPALHGLTE